MKNNATLNRAFYRSQLKALIVKMVKFWNGIKIMGIYPAMSEAEVFFDEKTVKAIYKAYTKKERRNIYCKDIANNKY